MYNENDWQEFRAGALKLNKDREETLLKKWLDIVDYKEPVGYFRNISNLTMEIYSEKVGVLIGKAGINVDKLKEMLAEEFGGKWEVKFIEIRGGFIVI